MRSPLVGCARSCLVARLISTRRVRRLDTRTRNWATKDEGQRVLLAAPGSTPTSQNSVRAPTSNSVRTCKEDGRQSTDRACLACIPRMGHVIGTLPFLLARTCAGLSPSANAAISREAVPNHNHSRVHVIHALVTTRATTAEEQVSGDGAVALGPSMPTHQAATLRHRCCRG